MEFPGIFGILFVLWCIIAPIVAFALANRARNDADSSESKAEREHRDLRRRFDALAARLDQSGGGVPPPIETPGTETGILRHFEKSAAPADAPMPNHGQEARSTTTPPPVPAPTPTVVPKAPEPIPVPLAPPPLPSITPEPTPVPFSIYPVPPIPRPFAKNSTPEPPEEPAFNWEQFIGAKLLVWAGCFALFLGAAYGIKYSFEHDLIPPAVRAAFGFLSGLALIVGGLRLNREKYAIMRQSLAATGTLILYAVTFACSSHDLWNLIPPAAGFALMSVITGAAFLLAVRLEARVVAVLGIAGGFLTPVLLSTGQDNPFGLFGYIALLNTGLLAVALNRRWHFLAGLGAVGTALMQMGWWNKFYWTSEYAGADKAFIQGYEGSGRIHIPMTVFLGMAALFTGAAWLAKLRGQTNAWFSWSALTLSSTAMIAAVPFIGAACFRDTPAIPFAYAFLVEALVFALAACDKRIRWAGPLAGGFVFLLLGWWTADRISVDNLNTALALYLAFALLHTAIPLTLKHLGKIAETPAWCHAFPLFALLLALIPAFRFDSLLVWPLLLLVDAVAVVLAVAGALLWPLLLVIAITVLAAVGAMLHIGQDLSGLNSWLLVLGGVSVAFIGLGVWLWKKFATASSASGDQLAVSGNAAIATMIPPISAGLPFLLLIMVTVRLPLADPSSVFGLALLLSVLLLGLAKLLRIGALAPVALAGVAFLEFAWQANHFSATSGNAGLALGWHLGFAVLFFAYPFVFHRGFANKVAPWAASVASLVVHFLLCHHTVMTAWPHDFPGLHPLLFALPAFAGLALVLKRTPQDSPARLAQLALFGGTALAFITTVFPLQFEHQWLTLAWAFEGVALLWLFRRVPHNGLRLAAFALLAATFARLALNPAVLSYHDRGDLPIWNWYLYAYGLAALAFSLAARQLKAPANLICGLDGSGLLRAASAVLGFLLLNIEIADFFSKPGTPVLTFDFSNNLPRDMSYTIAWGLFALGLLITGIVKRERAPRYAAIALLAVTLGKLFLHDLANLDQLYRIGALMGVAVIAIASSFLYQKFLAQEKK